MGRFNDFLERTGIKEPPPKAVEQNFIFWCEEKHRAFRCNFDMIPLEKRRGLQEWQVSKDVNEIPGITDENKGLPIVKIDSKYMKSLELRKRF